MNAILALYEPINTLKPVDDGLWIVDGPIVKMAMYGTAIPFSTRMTIARLSDGSLWCHSPIEFNAKLKADIDHLGPVRHLVSPNKIHYAHIATWADAYPEAKTWASPGVRGRALEQHIQTRFDADLSDYAPEIWSGDIEQLIFRGSRFMDEVVFFHKKSSTLILADLIENFESKKVNWKFHWLLRLMGVLDPDGKVPFDLRMTFWGGKKQAHQCFRRMIEWQPEKIIFAHGRWYQSNGVAELERAFRWLR